MKIYTKTGDAGMTGLVGGERVAKSDPRIEAYGTVDELNAALGLAVTSAEAPTAARLGVIQNELFTLGSHLATPEGSARRSTLPTIEPGWITRLEGEIDLAEAELPPLRQFILPGGSVPAAHLHLARTICRRAERCCVGLASCPAGVVTYLNRLSDWLFVMARLQNHAKKVADVPWVHNK